MEINKIDFQTPDWVCDFMVTSIHGYPYNILEPTPGNGNLVNAIKKHLPDTHILTPENDFMEMDICDVDFVIANPPFTPMTTGYQMLDRFFEVSGNVIVLMPWLTIINSEKRLDKLKANGLREIIHLPRSVFKGSRVQTCILMFTKGYRGDITFHDIKDLI